MHLQVGDISCKQNIHLSWSTSELRKMLVPLSMLKPSSVYLLTVRRRCFFCGSFLCVLFMLSCLYFAALWPPVGKRLNYWPSRVWRFLVFYDNNVQTAFRWNYLIIRFFTFINKVNPPKKLAQWLPVDVDNNRLYRSLYNKSKGRTHLNIPLLIKGFHIAFGVYKWTLLWP